MSKLLIVMRHGEAEWGSSAGGDHDRRLTDRGRASAARAGLHLSERGVSPGLLLCSTAARTRETADLVLEAGGPAPRAVHDPELYLADSDSILSHLAREGGETEVVLLVNHEPSCSSLVQRLTGASPGAFPTATMACIELEVDDWSQVGPGTGQLAWIQLP